MTITEVGCMGVKLGLNIMDDTTKEGQIMTGAYKAVAAAPGGPHQIHWGLEVQDPSKLWAFFEWQSIEDHENFAESFGGEAVKYLPQILTHGEFTKHVALIPSPKPALESPVTEAMLTYFPSDISLAEKDTATEKFQQVFEKVRAKCPDVKNISYGWGVENDFPVRGGEEGQIGSIFIALIGWPSLDAHMQFRDTDAYRTNSELIISMEGVAKLALFDISCRGLGRKTE